MFSHFEETLPSRIWLHLEFICMLLRNPARSSIKLTWRSFAEDTEECRKHIDDGTMEKTEGESLSFWGRCRCEGDSRDCPHVIPRHFQWPVWMCLLGFQASSLSMGFSRQEHWGGLPFPSPGDIPNPGIEPRSPALQADSLLSEPSPIMEAPMPI